MKIDTIILATGNKGKVLEMSAIIANFYAREDYVPHVVSMREIGFTAEIEEDGSTYFENACIKAGAVKAFLTDALSDSTDWGTWMVLADDSGVEYDALCGRPGIYSARWLDEYPTEEKNRRVLETLKDKKGAERNGSYQCYMAGLLEDGTVFEGHGELLVRAAVEPKGDGGFGYDPIMVLREEEYIASGLADLYDPDREETIAMLGTDVKNRVSHRNRALRDLFKKVLDK